MTGDQYQATYLTNQALVVQKADNAIHWIDPYPLNSTIGFHKIYPVDSTIQRLDNPGQVKNQSIIPSTDVRQLTLTLKMTTAQVVETPVTVNNNSPIQDYVSPNDQTQPTFKMTPGFKLSQKDMNVE